MDNLSFPNLLTYWSSSQVEANVLILLNTLGGLLLGTIVGYERSYHGRAAGIRTYGLVCMASSGLTAIVGFPHFWYGGAFPLGVMTDPTRVIQGIVTGIGFLGAGVIMKEGFNISGLSTAASIWTSSVIGVICGSGFYLAAIMITLVASASMILGGWIENLLPSRHAAAVILTFEQGCSPSEQDLKMMAASLGYRLAEGSTSIYFKDGCTEWHVIFLATTSKQVSIPNLANGLSQHKGLHAYQVAFARN